MTPAAPATAASAATVRDETATASFDTEAAMRRPLSTLPVDMPVAPIRIDCGPVMFGQRRALETISLTLSEARIAIVGRNGSGKTTLMRLIAGLIAPSSGSVRLGDIDPHHDRRGALRAIGIVFQNPDRQILFPTVEEELAFGLVQQGLHQREAVTRAREALGAAGRAHWAPMPVSALSGGQRQALCLMAVLLMKPANILLDEPFASLDLPGRARLARHLATLPQRVITIGHDPAPLEGAGRVLWLERGRLVADGPAGTVLPRYLAAMERLGRDDADADLAG